MPAPYRLIAEGEAALAKRVAGMWRSEAVNLGGHHRGIWFLIREVKKVKALAEFQVIDGKWEEIEVVSVLAERVDAARLYNLAAPLPYFIVAQCGWRVMWTQIKPGEIAASLAEAVEGRVEYPAPRFRPLAQ